MVTQPDPILIHLFAEQWASTAGCSILKGCKENVKQSTKVVDLPFLSGTGDSGSLPEKLNKLARNVKCRGSLHLTHLVGVRTRRSGSQPLCRTRRPRRLCQQMWSCSLPCRRLFPATLGMKQRGGSLLSWQNQNKRCSLFRLSYSVVKATIGSS